MRRAICALVAVLATTLAANAAPIDTLTGWNGTDNIIWMGEPNTATYGQTITVGADNVLKNFTFRVRQDSGAPVKFQGYVMAWNDALSRATGPVLYSSTLRQTTGTGGFETFTFNTGNLALTSGSQYVLFLNASNNFDGTSDAGAMASRAGGDAYAGGLFVFLNNGNSFGQVTTSSWTRNWQGNGFDAAFIATLEPGTVPEPFSMVVFGGLLAAGGLAVRRRMKVAA